MRFPVLGYVLGVFAGVVLGDMSSALAQGTHPHSVQSVGVIDAERILRQSTAYQGIRPQMQTLRKQFEDRFRAAEGELRTTKRNIEQERAILSPEAFAQRQREFRQRVQTVQRDMQGVNRILDRAMSDGVAKIQLKAHEIVRELAQEMKLDLILTNVAVAFARPKFDLTDRVLERLNKRMPSVKVALPQQNPAPQPGKK